MMHHLNNVRTRAWLGSTLYSSLLYGFSFGFSWTLYADALAEANDYVDGESSDMTNTESPVSLLPSEELLEFLIEFEKVDDETFHLLVQRGINDVEKTQKNTSNPPESSEFEKGKRNE